MSRMCRSNDHCSDFQRWECSQFNDWVDVDGRSPWGEEPNGHARYLLSASSDELARLAEIAFWSLDTGCWQGVATKNGGWEDGEPCDDQEQRWRLTARDFLDRYAAGDGHLTEGMLAYAVGDLARELANLRGWCPLGNRHGLIRGCP